MCCKLVKSLYGTPDAAINWAAEYTKVFLEIGFAKGASSPCTFYHSRLDMCLAVHGKDFIFTGTQEALEWVGARLRESFNIKSEMLRRDRSLNKEAKLFFTGMFNMAACWTDVGARPAPRRDCSHGSGRGVWRVVRSCHAGHHGRLEG